MMGSHVKTVWHWQKVATRAKPIKKESYAFLVWRKKPTGGLWSRPLVKSRVVTGWHRRNAVESGKGWALLKTAKQGPLLLSWLLVTFYDKFLSMDSSNGPLQFDGKRHSCIILPFFGLLYVCLFAVHNTCLSHCWKITSLTCLERYFQPDTNDNGSHVFVCGYPLHTSSRSQ